MRLGILADTHDQLDRTLMAIEILREEQVDVLFHCGDVTTPPILEACSILPCYFVFGNNDNDTIPELKLTADHFGLICLGWGDVVELAGKRIGLAHGHLTTDLRRIMAEHPDYVFSGHSHIRNDSRVGTVRRINPGALHRAEKFSVAVLDLESDDLRFLVVPKNRA